jgi:tetratricopeptide (TPR) repeat protein
MTGGALPRIGAAVLGALLFACAGAGGAPGTAARAEAAAGGSAGDRAPGRLAADYTAFLAMLDAGRSKAATGAAEALAREASAAVPAAPDLDVYAAAPLIAALRFGAWEMIVARPAPPADRPIAVALFQMARGVALAGRRDLGGAAAAREAFAAVREQVGSETRLGQDLAQDVLNVAGFVLDGRVLEAKGERDRALASWRAAAQAGDILSGTPPGGWYHALRESLGGALLRAGRYQEAEQAFRAGLARHPDGARLLFGLSLALAAEHRTAEADEARAKFETAWRRADVPLTLEDL